MSKHIEVKHKIQNIKRRSTFNELLEDSMLNEKEKKILSMYYLEGKTFDFIADDLGYSKAGVLKIHKKSLQKIEELL